MQINAVLHVVINDFHQYLNIAILFSYRYFYNTAIQISVVDKMNCISLVFQWLLAMLNFDIEKILFQGFIYTDYFKNWTAVLFHDMNTKQSFVEFFSCCIYPRYYSRVLKVQLQNDKHSRYSSGTYSWRWFVWYC